MIQVLIKDVSFAITAWISKTDEGLNDLKDHFWPDDQECSQRVGIVLHWIVLKDTSKMDDALNSKFVCLHAPYVPSCANISTRLLAFLIQ